MIEARAHDFKDARGWGIKLPAGTQVQSGQQVRKVTSKGTFTVTLGEYQGDNSYGDQLWTDAKGNRAGQPAQPAAPAGPPAQPAQSAPVSTGPAGAGGRVTLSEYITVCKLAYEDFVGSNIPPEQAGSMATSVAIQFARGAENDLDPFGG